ncbi:diguanylate cyclase (GGDEF) domain-containing protein [Epsilonproteobacteria bacterium SCGC AD-308-P11]|jgi:diguanylate cyclase (GGDEF)-like protein|nr:diguanylate cyclase (GGDEF) domain-containing protein [Epsilonproteobacteria bacterium SCGC AD-308-P11]
MKTAMKKYISALLFSALIVAGVSYYHYYKEEQHFNNEIDTKILHAAQIAHYIVGDHFHEKALISPPTLIQDMITIKELSSLAREEKMNYIYSLILDKEGVLHFTSSSAKDEELKTGINLTHFYDPYPSNANMIEALKTNKIVWDTNEEPDQWGKFRSVFIPHTTPSGVRYIIGADMELTKIEHLSALVVFKSVVASLIIFLGAIPLLLIYRHTQKETQKILREEVLEATSNLRMLNEKLIFRVEEKTEQLLAQTMTDPLTGLPNRHSLKAQIDNNKVSTLVILNLHNFQEINDFFGSSIGDDLLRQMAKWLQTLHHAHNESIYRLGGDEFLVAIEKKRSNKNLERLCRIFIYHLSKKVFQANGEEITLDVTIGIDNSSAISLAHADIALHQAKQSGKHLGFYLENYGAEERFQANIAMTKMIRKALNDNRIVCYYQPIVSIQTGEIEKYECLVRLIDSNGIAIPPIHFLEIAKKTRLYPQLTRAVAWNACNTFKNRNEEFSINLSISDIVDPTTVRFIHKTIKETNTSKRIVFEILESEGIEDFEAVISFIKKMKSLGAKIAIDDYGTGYSSIENILRLDIDYIKIDGSLIKQINVDPKNALVVESITEFATKLGAKTIAEFVSSEEIYMKIKSLGVSYSQGYYTGKPAPLPV